jgi:hypothetical protein
MRPPGSLTIITGFGGNQAIESAAALANSIKKLSNISNNQHPTQDQVVACLQDYQKRREVRAAAAIQASNFITHVQALATWGHTLFARYGLHYMSDFLENLTSDVVVGAIRIDYLPLPEGSLLGNMPFNPEQGEGHKENLLLRALLALPFLAVLVYAWMSSTLVTGAGSVTSTWYNNALTPLSLTGYGFGGVNNRYVLRRSSPHIADFFQICNDGEHPHVCTF